MNITEKQRKKLKEIRKKLIADGCPKKEAKSISKAVLMGLIEMEEKPIAKFDPEKTHIETSI